MTDGTHRTASNAVSILVVEDDLDTAESTALLLKLVGYDVNVARDGQQAIELARHGRPHCVLLDIGLPGLDGYKVASRLRQECADPLVIIAISGYGQDKDLRRSREVGIDHHLIKPTSLASLLPLLPPPGALWPPLSH